MKRLFAPLLALVLLSGACTTAQKAGDTARDGVDDAAKAPLYDINVLRTKIPPVLLDALEAPYSEPRPRSCAEIAAMVAPLDDALGPDLDTPQTEDDPGLLERGGEIAGNAMVDAMRGAAQSVIPLRSWVRKLSGAERHDRLVQAAITAGGVRRAYLKGMGQSLNCPPPNSPRLEARQAMPSGVYPRTSGPRYPIR